MFPNVKTVINNFLNRTLNPFFFIYQAKYIGITFIENCLLDLLNDALFAYIGLDE